MNTIYTDEQKAIWCCKFNCWEWPEDFPIQKPEGFDAMSIKEKFDNFPFRIAIDGLRANCTEREQSRQWWLMQMPIEGKISREEAETQ